MKAIIFGVTGQAGSYLVELLLEKGYTVVGVTRRVSTSNTQRISHVLNNENFVIEEGDITDAHSVMNILKKHQDADHIYNLAAQSHVAVSFKQPGLTWDITGKGCLNILQGIVDLGMLGTRFYQASSSEMFGASYDIARDGTKYQNEDTKFLPQSPYAIAKCAAHYMTRLYREAYGVHASAGILFNHESQRRGETFVTRKITKWIGEFKQWLGYTQMVATDENTIYKANSNNVITAEFPKLRLGNLESFRDWGHAKDFVKAMHMMLCRDYPSDYVICTGETHTVREFLDIAFKEVGIENWEPYVVVDPEFYRPAEVDYLRGDCSKAKSVLGWEPDHSFADLVRDMVQHDVRLAAKYENLQTPHINGADPVGAKEVSAV